uniref:Uncharacterized protein n=1 Tax=Arundo donax TaxID=35708 RepID=A0A0A8ZW34_ARUDO
MRGRRTVEAEATRKRRHRRQVAAKAATVRRHGTRRRRTSLGGRSWRWLHSRNSDESAGISKRCGVFMAMAALDYR